MVKWKGEFRRWLRHRRIAVDTSFLIPALEDVESFEEAPTRFLRLAERRSLSLITSSITLLELLVHPYRMKDMEAVNRYYGYLTDPFVDLIPLTAEIADRAAEIRARYGFKTPDAVQMATALIGEATLLLTLDKDFNKQKEIEVGLL